MEFYDLDFSYIQSKGIIEGGFLKYNIGKKIEVTTMKKKNSNFILSDSLSSKKLEDKMMIRYNPNNEIYFDMDLFEDNTDTKLLSCYINKENYSVCIGREGKYEIGHGVLLFSGDLSVNNLVSSHKTIYANSQYSIELLRKKVRVLSVGLCGDELLGLLYIPKERGIAISWGQSDLGLSAKTWKPQNCEEWGKLQLSDFFIGSKIKELA